MPLIVFEGIDGCGKTTQVDRLCAHLERERVAHRRLREPGGTVLGEAMRRMLLDPATKAAPVAELFGYLQARAQLCDEVLAPALARHETVILDRFYHSTIAYQAFGLGLDRERVRAAIELAIGRVKPDVVIWLDLEPAEAERRRDAVRAHDRIEARGLAYLQRVHAGYHALAEEGELQRVDARMNVDDLEQLIWTLIAPLVAPPVR
ncbi:MAG: dTMP kinase [Planctomycetes bacterium]|nr:dTMP kinase [Planctomycetota bacterium]